jgi:lipopolysaccharide/colanic/teichoic acid biosynthesis glycosyltransferase
MAETISKLFGPLAHPLTAPPVAPLPEADLPEHGDAAASWSYDALKLALDGTLAALVLIMTAPVVLLAAVLVKLTSRGPAFYTQVRVGRHERLFTIYKLRTMTVDSEAATGAVWCRAGDPRVTPLGRLLRATHIDEFPQLLNVLRGEMSLIGPRPERPEIVNTLETKIDGYMRRLEVLPGISGLAQIQLPPDTCLEEVRRKLICDLHYIGHRSIGLDLRIMICTGVFLAGVPLRWSRRLLRIPEPLQTARAS